MATFRTSDLKRVQMAFDSLLAPPFEAVCVLEDGRKTLKVTIEDPDTPGLPVAQCSFPFQEEKTLARMLQPTEGDLAATVSRMCAACDSYAPAE